MHEVIPIHEAFWKVIVDEGLAGYVDKIAASDGVRFRARRLNVQHRRWVALGEYWDLETAVEALTT